ncbi:glycosyltransferase family 8 protein [Empedobacter sp.]|uniref:glycosyltransferase family 8 protein n=1 Tax=Empedobacter sp. TaxID=1927715 RepID=UPI0028A07563|nr:glycosyltransferase family 8 protein [Empedobacter sp.]
MTIFPIVFACDDKYIKYTSVTIASIISNSKKNINYKFYILTEFISEKNMNIMNSFITKHKNCSIEYVILNNLESSSFYVQDYYSITTYYRFYISELFKQYERVLYLDSDIIVDSDISELLLMDFENNGAIAIQDTKHSNFIESGGDDWYSKEYFYNELKLSEPNKYFNAGVMLFNIKKINEENIQKKLFDKLSKVNCPKLQDQDILNSILTRYGGVKLISNKYNFMTSIRVNPYKISYKDIICSRIKSILKLINKDNKPFYIYHFVEAAKPWKSKRLDRLLFYKYLFSIHEVTPPICFINEILNENNRRFPMWWKLFMKFFS